MQEAWSLTVNNSVAGCRHNDLTVCLHIETIFKIDGCCASSTPNQAMGPHIGMNRGEAASNYLRALVCNQRGRRNLQELSPLLQKTTGGFAHSASRVIWVRSSPGGGDHNKCKSFANDSVLGGSTLKILPSGHLSSGWSRDDCSTLAVSANHRATAPTS